MIFLLHALEFNGHKTIAMHVLQRLVYILGTNHAYVMIHNGICAWE